MPEEESKFNYQGQVFASKEAMDLYKASRGAAIKNYSDFGTLNKKKMTWQYVTFGLTSAANPCCWHKE